MLRALLSEFKSSIKSPDTEEKLDLLLYRPCGFLIAKIAWFLQLTPTILSLIGLVFGLISAIYYLEAKNNSSLVWASIFLVFSGIFDSSDGQLARLSKQSSKLGLILDGICDSLVTLAIYAACALPFINLYGLWYIAVVVVALHFHSCQCAILDFYHREYLFFGYGKVENDTYWNPSLADGIGTIKESSSKKERVMNRLRLTWIQKQQWLTSRSDEERIKMKEKILSLPHHEKENFMLEYRKHNLWLLPFWRLVGVNAHTLLIIYFMFLRRFDIYMVFFDIVLLNVVIFLVGQQQKKSDRRFLKKVRLI